MKKTICVILLIFLVIIVCIYMNYKQFILNQNDIKKFNNEYEYYNKESLLGTDITTVINKAINNNQNHSIAKDEDGLYVSDDEYCIKIFVYMLIDEKTYPMESLEKAGLAQFTQYFGEVRFKCTEVKYHEKNGQIAEMTFASLDY